VAKLNNNQFSGFIPADIKEMTSLDELLIYTNQITGSVPSQLGQLRNLSSISVAHNLLKGTIPTEVLSMQNLSLFHLHSNMLTGDINSFDYSIESFISDCGGTEVSKAKIKCPDCTECCNDDGQCITVAKTWPKDDLKQLDMPPGVFIIILLLGLSFILMMLGMVIRSIGNKLPQLPYVIVQTFQRDSVYRWFLSSNKTAWVIAIFSTVLQIYINLVFLRAGDATFPGNLWLYSLNCPDDTTSCADQREIDLTGWICFVFVIAVFLLKDFISGLLLFYDSSINYNVKGIIAGIVVFNVTALSVVASVIFLNATSISNIAIIQNAIIVSINVFSRIIYRLRILDLYQ